MPIFDRLDGKMPEDDEQPHKDADKGREPRLVPAQLGSRMVSLAALVEKIVNTFIEEHSDSQTLREADTETKRLKLILETVNYVLAVESVHPTDTAKAEIIAQTYSELFGYGPLDALFIDERITTILLEGIDKASVRYGHGELVTLSPLFEDLEHMQRIIGRLLMDAGVELRESQPYLETGLIVGDRSVSLNLVSPPVAPQLNVDIRVHPKTLPTLDDLVMQNILNEKAAEFLRALVKSSHGFLIVGDPESGKTTLLSVLAQLLLAPEQVISVERAGELRLPAGAQRLMTKWTVGNQTGISFGEQIGAALEKKPTCILLDEVRADEPEMIAPLLSSAAVPRQIWSFRGTVEAKRLQNALGMLARRADTSRSEVMVTTLYRRLPFIVTVRRRENKLQLYSIGEWQFRDNSDYPTYTLLMKQDEGNLVSIGQKPTHDFGLPDDFWI
jgi:Flp pilus assembly CpaF family ATPase